MEKLKNLRTYNVVMGFLHLGQAVLMYYLSNSFALPLTTTYLQWQEQGYPAPVTETATELTLGPWVALFLLLSALAHFVISLPEVYEWYLRKLKKEINYVRWYEYALSSSIMIVVIAMLSGVYDLWLLVSIFSLNAIMNLFGLMMEKHNQTTKKTDWTAYLFGVYAGLVPWIVIAAHFYAAISDVSENIPIFVYYILGSLFLFFNSFAINMFLQYKKVGPWKDYMFGEKVYIFLSLAAKTALAWQVWGGTMRPDN